MCNWRVFLESLFQPFAWFFAKFICGVIVGFAVYNAFVQIGGKTVVDVPVYVAGAVCLITLYLISDVRTEYQSRMNRMRQSPRRRRY